MSNNIYLLRDKLGGIADEPAILSIEKDSLINYLIEVWKEKDPGWSRENQLRRLDSFSVCYEYIMLKTKKGNKICTRNKEIIECQESYEIPKQLYAVVSPKLMDEVKNEIKSRKYE